MGKNSKRTKRNCKTYALVYRPHDDPLYGNPNVSPWVLARIHKQKRNGKQQEEEEDPFDYRANIVTENEPSVELEYDPRDFELGEYNFDLKSYDYKQHLKEVSPVAENLSEVDLEKQIDGQLYEIIREVKSRTGQYIGVDMAARELEARKQLEEDKKRNKDVEKVLELLETWSEQEDTLDQVSEKEEDLEDDFVLIAQGEEYKETESTEDKESNMDKSGRAITTNQKQLLEEKFEHFFASLYDSDADSYDNWSNEAPEYLDIENSLQFTPEKIQQLISELNGCSLSTDSVSDRDITKIYDENEWFSETSQQDSSDNESADEKTESIFSFYSQQKVSKSNNVNTPHLIGEDFHGEPKSCRGHNSLPSHKPNKLDSEEQTTPVKPEQLYRNRNESRDEKKARKQAVKEWRAFRRAKKSEWRKLFRQERQRQAKQTALSGKGKVVVEQ